MLRVPLEPGAFTETVTLVVELTVSEGSVQVTTLPDRLQVQPVPEADTNAVPVGNVSIRVTELAVVGPLFVTWRA